MDVQSSQNKGTTVTFYLPLPDQPLAKIEESKAQPSVSHAKILFMDDEVCLQDLAKTILEDSDYTIEVASDGTAAQVIFAQALLTESPFDLVILDLTIPGGIGGKETQEALLLLDPEIKGIVVSGYSSDPILSNFEDYGFHYSLEKPYMPDSLIKAIQCALEQ